jgi:hypothetical protein
LHGKFDIMAFFHGFYSIPYVLRDLSSSIGGRSKRQRGTEARSREAQKQEVERQDVRSTEVEKQQSEKTVCGGWKTYFPFSSFPSKSSRIH